MTKKNAFSLLMTSALMASMVVPAFALGGSSTTKPSGGSTNTQQKPSGGSTTTTTEMSVAKTLDYNTIINMPTIDVEMTANNSVVVNPYRLTYTIPAVTAGEEGTEDNSSVITATNVITSKSSVPLNVAVSITSKAGDKVEWGTALVDTDNMPTNRVIALDFMMQQVADADSAESLTWDADPENKGAWDGITGAKEATEAAVASAKAQDIFLDGTTQTFGNEEGSYYYVMAPAADDENPTCAAFKLVGNCSETSGTEAWTAADTVTVSTAFTFTMLPNVISTT